MSTGSLYPENPLYNQLTALGLLNTNVGKKFKIGDVVVHRKFGIGAIISIYGVTKGNCNIMFNDFGEKALIMKFAKLKKLKIKRYDAALFKTDS